MTQRDLATSTNLAQSAIARLESKNATPRLDTVLRVLAPLGYTLAIVSTDTESTIINTENPNSTTIAAIENAEKHTDMYGPFTNVNAVMQELNK